MITLLRFEENTIDQYIYFIFSGRKFIILILYVDDILLASSDKALVHKTKKFLSSHFEMKDLGDASFVLRIEIHHDHFSGILGLSQMPILKRSLVGMVCKIVHLGTHLWKKVTNLAWNNALKLNLRLRRCINSLMLMLYRVSCLLKYVCV